MYMLCYMSYQDHKNVITRKFNFSETGCAKCDPCPAGYEADGTGLTTCDQCQPGLFLIIFSLSVVQIYIHL